MKTPITRRSILASTLALGASGVALPRMAFAQGVGTKKLLVVLQRGAADGLAMLAPMGDSALSGLRKGSLDEYASARKADGFFAIHPALEAVGNAYASGEALFVHATATSYRERSHFEGQNMLETGASEPYAKSDGWLNRLVALMAEETRATPPRALALAPTMPLALRGAAPASSYAPSGLPEASEDFLARVGMLYQGDDQLSSLWDRALQTQAMASDDGLKNLRDARATGELAASLMRGPDGARIAMIESGGWDSHANQQGAFRRNARQLDAMLGAYREAMGDAWASTMVLVITEFGRTVRFNGTNGTDHGTASAALVLGGSIRGGRVIADWPGLGAGDLYEGRDLRPTIALEHIVTGALSEHMGIDPNRALAKLFPGRTGSPISGIAA